MEREEVRNKEQTHHTNKAPAPGKMHELPQIVRTVQISGRFFESEWRIVEREEVRNKEQTHHTNKAPAPGKMHELPQIVRTVQKRALSRKD